MVDPISVISLVEGSIGLVLQCGSVAKTLSDMIAKSKHAEVSITSMIQEVETIQFAWNRIKEWSEEHAEAATDSQFVQRLEKSLQCGTLVLSALEQDLANYKHAADNASFIMRSKMAWNERAFLDHQHRVRGQVQAMTLMLQVSQLPTSKDRTKFLKKKDKIFRASDASAYSIVPSRVSSRWSISTRSRMSVLSIDSNDLVYRPLSFEDDLFTARVYKRNYQNRLVSSLYKTQRGKTREGRRISVTSVEASENGSSFPQPPTGPTLLTTMSVDFSQPHPTDQETALQNLRPVSPSLVGVAGTSPIPPTQYALNPSLRIAVEEGKLDDARTLIDRGAQVNRPNATDRSPLYLAVCEGDPFITELLLQKGANCAQEWRGTPPIHQACKDGELRIARLLLDAGASVSSLDAFQQQPLHIVLSWRFSRPDASDLIDLLISRGAEINARTQTHETPLHLACKYGDVDNIRALLTRGADANCIDGDGRTPLHILAANVGYSLYTFQSYPAISRLLYEHGANVDAQDQVGDTPLHFLAKRDSFMTDKAQWAAYQAVFQRLVEHGAKSNAQNRAEDTPVDILVKQGIDELSGWSGYQAIFQVLLEHGANFDAQDKAGDTPLHILARRKSSEGIKIEWEGQLTQWLVDAGADLHISNCTDESPLNLARAEDKQWFVRIAHSHRGSDLANLTGDCDVDQIGVAL